MKVTASFGAASACQMTISRNKKNIGLGGAALAQW